MNDTRVKVYGYRWVVLLAFMLVNTLVQMLWICYAPVTGIAAGFYGVSDHQIGFLAEVFMVVYLPMSLPASWVIDTLGLRKGIGLGVVVVGVFGLLRGVFSASYTMALLMSIGIAIGQPVLMNAWAKVAARWFPLQERATAIGLSAVATFIGIALGEALTPLLVDACGFTRTHLIYGIASAGAAVLYLILIREHPPTPASPAGEEERALVLAGLRHIFRQRDFYLLAAAVFVGGGIFNGVSTWVEPIVRPRGLSPTQAGTLAAIMLMGGVVGAVIVPLLSDRLRMRKVIIIAGAFGSIPALVGLALTNSFAPLVVLFFLLGLCITGILPVAYQYGAEITLPAPEGTSNGLFALATQISVVFVYGMSWFESKVHSFVPSLLGLAGLMGLGVVLLTFMRESQNMRPDGGPRPDRAPGVAPGGETGSGSH